MHIIIPKKKSKRVESFNDIKKETEALQAFLENGNFSPRGAIEKQAFALHHSQVDPEPFNFFVIKREVVKAKPNEIVVIVNPEIIEKDKSTRIWVKEGCCSFPFRPDKRVQRCEKIKVKFQIPNEKGGMIDHEEELIGFMAFIFQHEIEHAQGRHIYM